MADVSVPYEGGENLDVMEHARHYNLHIARLLFAHFRPDSRILDFGAGNGTFSRILRARGYRVECLEIDPRYRELLAAEGFPVRASLAEIPEASLDGVYLLNVLEHIPDDVGELRAIGARLRPGGKVCVYVPAFQALYSAMDRSIGHCRRYTRRDLAAKLVAAGFEPPTTRYHDCLGFPATLLYKAVGDRSGRIDVRRILFYDRVVFPLSQALDPLFRGVLGKNVSAVAVRPA